MATTPDYESVRRIGLLLPSSNTLIEPECNALAPSALSLHVARLPMTTLDEDGLRAQQAAISAQTRLLADARVEAVLFCQTSASFHLGIPWNRELRLRIHSAAQCPALIAAETVTDALHKLDVRTVSVASPFPAPVLTSTMEYLRSSGFTVVHAEGLGVTDNFEIARISESDVRALVQRANVLDCDAVLVPGGNMPCTAFISSLEDALGKPVVTTNQAALWAIREHLSLDWTPTTLGSLFS